MDPLLRAADRAGYYPEHTMAISLADLEKNPDGSVPGVWRVRLFSGLSCGLPGAHFVDGVAENVPGARLRSLVAAMGHDIAEVKRTDVVEAPIIDAAEVPAEAPKEAPRRGRPPKARA